LKNLENSDPADIIQQINTELLFQFAPRALAHIRNRNNSFEMKLTPAPANQWNGLEVQLVWKEIE